MVDQKGSGNRFVYAGIGSRDVHPDIILLMRNLGKRIAQCGGMLRSGGAIGSDTAFYEGLALFEEPSPKNARIYLAWNGMGGHVAEAGTPFVDASRLPNFEQGLEMALEARGSFIGLGRGGIALHGRNSYQVLGDGLNDPVDLVILYAKPVKNGVKGGTNTAYKIAVKHKVPVLNLYLTNDRFRASAFLLAESIDKLKILAQELKSEQYPHEKT